MTASKDLVILPLGQTHDRAEFRCGIEALDRYLVKQAGQDVNRRISRVFVATTPANPKTVIGYYALSALAIDLNQLPVAMAGKLPRHPIPAALIGRLAVRQNVQGHGIGRLLLADAIKRTLAVADQIAFYAMVVDALNDKSISFYEKYGFIRLCADRPRLFLPLKSFESSRTHNKAIRPYR